MRRKPDPFQIRLYGLTEAAEYLGVGLNTLDWHRRNGKLIRPVAELACGPVWSESQLDEQLWMWRGRLRPARRYTTPTEGDDDPCRHLETQRKDGKTECVTCGRTT